MLIKNTTNAVTTLTDPRLLAVKALLVDIDGTIIRAKRKGDECATPLNTASLLEVLHLAGVSLGGLSSQETDRRIRKVQKEIRWWHWSDFILELELDPKAFWQFAYETEHRYSKLRARRSAKPCRRSARPACCST